jgi:hypothetical protein
MSPDCTLWVWRRSHIDDAMLEEIAAADYGIDVEYYLRVLTRIRDEKVLLNPPEPHPTEVAGLLREIGTRIVDG